MQKARPTVLYNWHDRQYCTNDTTDDMVQIAHTTLFAIVSCLNCFCKYFRLTRAYSANIFENELKSISENAFKVETTGHFFCITVINEFCNCWHNYIWLVTAMFNFSSLLLNLLLFNLYRRKIVWLPNQPHLLNKYQINMSFSYFHGIWIKNIGAISNICFEVIWFSWRFYLFIWYLFFFN